MSDKRLKVTDRRMFTADGELREEYRELAASAPSGAGPGTAPQPPPAAPEPPPAARPPERPLEPAPPEAPDAPGFFDLVGLLAEPASIYLREARGADPQTAAQSLELARLHIDLLQVLRIKTQGNLSPPEDAMLKDVIHQLRSSFVGLRS